jgi:hypothetical protein
LWFGNYIPSTFFLLPDRLFEWGLRWRFGLLGDSEPER